MITLQEQEINMGYKEMQGIKERKKKEVKQCKKNSHTYSSMQ